MYNTVYALPIHFTVIVLVVFAVIWDIFISRMSSFVRFISLLLMVMWFVVVLDITLFSRTSYERDVCFIPFYQLITALQGGNPELYRTFYMNILMFTPCGFLLPELLSPKWHNTTKFVVILVFAFIFSASIEFFQWYCHLGETEMDDVVANVFGALLSFGLVCACRKIRKKIVSLHK